jgi:hypothetical protein
LKDTSGHADANFNAPMVRDEILGSLSASACTLVKDILMQLAPFNPKHEAINQGAD